jgi:hypothetical protein
LANELRQVIGAAGEGDGVFSMPYAVTCLQNFPSEHDVFAYSFWPATDFHQCFSVVQRKGTLCHKRALKQRLNPLDGSDA